MKSLLVLDTARGVAVGVVCLVGEVVPCPNQFMLFELEPVSSFGDKAGVCSSYFSRDLEGDLGDFLLYFGSFELLLLLCDQEGFESAFSELESGFAYELCEVEL